MAYWTGLALAAIAAVFLVSGWRRRQAVRAERVALGYAPGADTPQRRDPYSTVSIVGDAVPPIVIGFLALIGIKAVFFYAALGGGIFTVVDLAGFLMMLGGYGAWMWWHSRYRFADLGARAPAQQTPAQQTPAQPTPADHARADQARADQAPAETASAETAAAEAAPGAASHAGDAPDDAPGRRHVA